MGGAVGAVGRIRRAAVKKPAEIRTGRWWVIPASLLLALFLNLIPYPEWARFARPDWVTLALFYWCLATPERVGVGHGWCLGLLLDVMQYTLFGQQALGKALVALVAVSVHRRLRLYPLWQQCTVILAVAALDVVVVAGIYQLIGGGAFRLNYWQGALSTALLWPMVYVMLRSLRQRSGIVRR